MISMDREYRHAHTLQERLGQKIMRSLIIIPTGIPEDDNRIIRRKPKSFFELEQFFYISVRVAGIVNQCCQILSVLNDDAITDHGVMSGVVELCDACDAIEKETGKKVKPIYGCEVYFTTDDSFFIFQRTEKSSLILLNNCLSTETWTVFCFHQSNTCQKLISTS